MTASLSAYSLVNRNGVRFYLRNFSAFAGMTLLEFNLFTKRVSFPRKRESTIKIFYRQI
ncbi:MAG: hypothetical protein ACYCSW_01735 [bacterium]